MKNRLTAFALKHGSDKAGHHSYTEIYERYFAPLQYDPIVLLELGIGGYEFADRGGASLKMWQDYFSDGSIHGIDIHIKNGLDTDRITTHVGCQNDETFLYKVIGKTGIPDIIIDDASHVSAKTIRSFEILFPVLFSGGIYVVEDTHASYWTEHGFEGGDHDRTTMNYFKRMADLLNREHCPWVDGPEWTKEILSIHFYEKMIFILKK